MSSQRDVSRIVRSWLRDDEHESADRVLDAVLDQLDTTPQRRALPWTAWRLSDMNTLFKFGLAVTAAVVAVVVGINLFGTAGVGGPDVASPAATSPSPTLEPEPLPRGLTELEGGRYLVDNADWALHPFTLDIPDGWTTDNGFIANVPGGMDPGQAVFTFWIVDSVYAESCDWQGTLQRVGTPDEIVDALVAQSGHETTVPEWVTIDGHASQRVEMSVPDDFDASGCDDGFMRLWPDPGQDEGGGLPILPGGRITADVVDIDGSALVLLRIVMPDAPPADVALLDAMLASVDIVDR